MKLTFVAVVFCLVLLPNDGVSGRLTFNFSGSSFSSPKRLAATNNKTVTATDGSAVAITSDNTAKNAEAEVASDSDVTLISQGGTASVVLAGDASHNDNADRAASAADILVKDAGSLVVLTGVAATKNPGQTPKRAASASISVTDGTKVESGGLLRFILGASGRGTNTRAAADKTGNGVLDGPAQVSATVNGSAIGGPNGEDTASSDAEVGGVSS